MFTTALPPKEERRIFERFSARFPVKIKDSREEFGKDIFLQDASAQGMRLTARERFFLNDNLALEVELPDGKAPMVLSGHVVWVKLMNMSMWDIGVEFSQVNLLKMQRLFKLTDNSA